MEHSSGLLTDLYELTMGAGYIETGLHSRASFELFARNLPAHRNYLVVAGIEEALDFLEKMHFEPEEIEYLRKHPTFRKTDGKFFDWLRRFRFSGNVWAMPEGTLAFAGEPILRVEAPVAEAQLVETCLLAAVHFQTLVATKAARVVTAARGRQVVEFGARRAHGIEAGVLAARAAWIAGCSGTSNTYAGERYGIPTFGTQAHSWVMAHKTEEEAFAQFLDLFPQSSTLLVDTYDTRQAIETIIQMGRKPSGVRLDSGDLAGDSRWARKRLKQAGWGDVRIFASGDLDEWKIDALLRAGAEVDGFGVGTAMVTSADAPSIGFIYKLVEVGRNGRRVGVAKFSPAKATYPGAKQVFRFRGQDGSLRRDLIALAAEEPRGGEALLKPALRDGRRLREPAKLDEARRRCREQLAALPERYRKIDAEAKFPVKHSARLEAMFRRMKRTALGRVR